MTVQCCKCKKIRVGSRWVALYGPLLGEASHTYCPTCADEFHIEAFSSFASESTPSDAHRLRRMLKTLAAANI